MTCPSGRAAATGAAAVVLLASTLASAQTRLATDVEGSAPPWGANAAWMNGEQRPARTLVTGPAVWSAYVDGYFAWDVNAPVDHTSFFNSVASRHNEVQVNLASVGVDIAPGTGAGPYARLHLQWGTMAAATVGRDGTTARGYYLTPTAFDTLREAAVGWHFDSLHGINVEGGLLPSYLAPDSYLPGENWYYSRPFLAEFTPRYLMGLRAQFRLARADLEVWATNGWQVLGEWHASSQGPTSKVDNLEWGSIGTYANWRPTEWLSLADATYVAASSPVDPGAVRLFDAATIQARYARTSGVQAAISLAADVGWESRANAPSGAMAGAILAHRLDFGSWAWTVRGDYYTDVTQALVVPLPNGYPLASRTFAGFGFGTNVDFKPTPWFLLRLDYAFRSTNIPYLSGSYGITGPGGFPNGQPYTPDLGTTDMRAIVNGTVAF